MLRVRVERWDRAAAGRAMASAPVVGVVLGAMAAGAGALVAWRAGGLLGAVAAVGVLAALTRGCTWTGWPTSPTAWAAASQPRMRCAS